MFPDVCAPSPCSGPSPATFGLQLGEEGGQRKDKVSSRVSSARSPIRLGRSAFSSRVDAPPGWSAIPAARLALLPLPPPRAWPGFRSLNNPSSNCDDGGDSSWEPGLSHPPPWPSPACPRAPWPERNVEPSPVPSPSWPLSAVSVQRHACARVRLYPYELRVLGSPGRERVITVETHSRGRSNPEHRSPRQGDATITVKTNPHPLSPPARLSRRPRDAAAALAGGGDHSLDAPPL